MTPGGYLKRRRTAAGLGTGDVAAALATEPHMAQHARAEWIEWIETDVLPASFNTIVALRRAFRFDLTVLAQLAATGLSADLEPPRLCRLCACSETDACLGFGGACSWVQADLCSACCSHELAGRDATIGFAAARDSAA